MTHTPVIRPAEPDEAGYLSDLALRSKAYWGYSEDFLESCRSELSIEPERIVGRNYEYLVAAQDGSILGFCALEAVAEDTSELEALFVEPRCIGQGIGRLLVRHALESLSKRGVKRLLIQGDPHAAGFYLSIGAREVGRRESDSVPGRFLPLFEVDVRTR